MNTKTIIQALAAVTLLTASQAVVAKDVASKAAGRITGLDNAVRAMYLEAHATIQADIYASIKATPLVFDEPGVSTGKVEIVAEADSRSRPDAGEDAQVDVLAASTDVPVQQTSPEIRLDILHKALATPGLFGVYRYVTATAAKAAVIVVK